MYKQTNKNKAFTIVELLTVMSIIVILISLLVPSLNKIRRYARKVKQKAQFHSIDVALELYSTEFEGYPDSYALDQDGDSSNPAYCGAMRLAEAMMGMDLLGFHPSSLYDRDGVDGLGGDIYATLDNGYTPNRDNLKARRGPYLQLQNANAHRIQHIASNYATTGGFDKNSFVLCDVYTTIMLVGPAADDAMVGKRSGMPILYYKADTSGIDNDETNPTSPDNIYNYLDNHALVELFAPQKLYEDPTATPSEAQGERFYMNLLDPRIVSPKRPYRSDSYILLSAGFDGEYGTDDDIYNFNN